jgi:hypothetical protein
MRQIPFDKPLPVPGVRLDRPAPPVWTVAPDPFFQEKIQRPNTIPSDLAAIRDWISQVEAPDLEWGPLGDWPDEEVLARWNNIWKPMVEEAERNPPSLIDIAKAQVLAATIKSHLNLESLTPTQLAVYLGPTIRALETNSRGGTRPNLRFAKP